MTIKPDERPDVALAARCYAMSRIIHWVTVALVIALLVTALLGNIDPHGPGNGAFIWHSSLGIALYLLSISRVLLWLIYRPTVVAPTSMGGRQGIDRALRLAFYALLLALPISGWFLASEEGMRSTHFGIPALPQWYHEGAIQHTIATPDSTIVVVFDRIHSGLAASLFVVIAAHLFTTVRARGRR